MFSQSSDLKGRELGDRPWPPRKKNKNPLKSKWLKHYATSWKIADSSPDDFLILPATIWPWGLLNLWEKWIPEDLSGDKARPAHEAYNVTTICEPIVWIS
jgi:hypothetical protein